MRKRLIFGVDCGIIIIEKMREEYISPQIKKVFKKDLQFGFDYGIIYIEKLRKLLNLFKKMKGTLCSVGRVKGGKYGKNQIN